MNSDHGNPAQSESRCGIPATSAQSGNPGGGPLIGAVASGVDLMLTPPVHSLFREQAKSIVAIQVSGETVVKHKSYKHKVLLPSKGYTWSSLWGESIAVALALCIEFI